MPRVRQLYIPPPNLAKDLISRTMRENRITSEQLAKMVHMKPESVRRKKMKGIWTTEEFRTWCLALGIDDPETVGKAVLNRT